MFSTSSTSFHVKASWCATNCLCVSEGILMANHACTSTLWPFMLRFVKSCPCERPCDVISCWDKHKTQHHVKYSVEAGQGIFRISCACLLCGKHRLLQDLFAAYFFALLEVHLSIVVKHLLCFDGDDCHVALSNCVHAVTAFLHSRSNIIASPRFSYRRLVNARISSQVHVTATVVL